MLARAHAPTSNGSKMVLSRFTNKGPGSTVTPDPDAPRMRHSTKGMVKTPSRLDDTVSSSASAVLPPTVCKATIHVP